MAKYTILQRDHLTRAEVEEATIKHLQLCGYVVRDEIEASSSQEALDQYQLTAKVEQKAPVVPKKYRKFLWLGLVCAVLWFCYVIFGLLPLAFPD